MSKKKNFETRMFCKGTSSKNDNDHGGNKFFPQNSNSNTRICFGCKKEGTKNTQKNKGKGKGEKDMVIVERPAQADTGVTII